MSVPRVRVCVCVCACAHHFTCHREVHLEGGSGRKHQSWYLGSTASGLGYSNGSLLVFFTSEFPENTALVPRSTRNTPKTSAHRQHAQRDRAIAQAPPPAS